MTEEIALRCGCGRGQDQSPPLTPAIAYLQPSSEWLFSPGFTWQISCVQRAVGPRTQHHGDESVRKLNSATDCELSHEGRGLVPFLKGQRLGLPYSCDSPALPHLLGYSRSTPLSWPKIGPRTFQVCCRKLWDVDSLVALWVTKVVETHLWTQA